MIYKRGTFFNANVASLHFHLSEMLPFICEIQTSFIIEPRDSTKKINPPVPHVSASVLEHTVLPCSEFPFRCNMNELISKYSSCLLLKFQLFILLLLWESCAFSFVLCYTSTVNSVPLTSMSLSILTFLLLLLCPSSSRWSSFQKVWHPGALPGRH